MGDRPRTVRSPRLGLEAFEERVNPAPVLVKKVYHASGQIDYMETTATIDLEKPVVVDR